jgi:hypothetical protein
MHKTENEKYPKVRVTRQARAHLEKLIPAIRETRGLNVSMTDIVSELILSEPIPAMPTPKRRARKAAETNAVSVAAMPAA